MALGRPRLRSVALLFPFVARTRFHVPYHECLVRPRAGRLGPTVLADRTFDRREGQLDLAAVAGAFELYNRDLASCLRCRLRALLRSVRSTRDVRSTVCMAAFC